MNITPQNLNRIGFKEKREHKWFDESITEVMYVKGSYFVEFTNNNTIIVFAKFYERSSVHLRNVSSIRQIKALYKALTS